MTFPPGSMHPVPDPEKEMERLAEMRRRAAAPMLDLHDGNLLRIRKDGINHLMRVTSVEPGESGGVTIRTEPVT